MFDFSEVGRRVVGKASEQGFVWQREYGRLPLTIKLLLTLKGFFC